MASATLTQESLKGHLHYDPRAGVFRRIFNGVCVESAIVGSDNGQGYLIVRVAGKRYRAHRLAFLYMTGKLPCHEVDHINGIRSDNRWENLREVTSKQNTHNQRKAHRNGTTGFLGVRTERDRFKAVISVDGKRRRLGVFDSAQQAHAAYVHAKRKLHESCTL